MMGISVILLLVITQVRNIYSILHRKFFAKYRISDKYYFNVKYFILNVTRKSRADFKFFWSNIFLRI